MRLPALFCYIGLGFIIGFLVSNLLLLDSLPNIIAKHPLHLLSRNTPVQAAALPARARGADPDHEPDSPSNPQSAHVPGVMAPIMLQPPAFLEGAPRAMGAQSSSLATPELVPLQRLSVPADTLAAADLAQLRNMRLIWDFGSCGCTGWGIEIVNFVVPLQRYVPDIGIITGRNCFCPGFSDRTLKTLDAMADTTDRFARADNADKADQRCSASVRVANAHRPGCLPYRVDDRALRDLLEANRIPVPSANQVATATFKLKQPLTYTVVEPVVDVWITHKMVCAAG